MTASPLKIVNRAVAAVVNRSLVPAPAAAAVRVNAAPGVIQRAGTLRVSSPSDPAEREAEHTARQVMQLLRSDSVEGMVIIDGPFGHEWQYESPFPIRRFRPEFLGEAQAVVCIEECPGMVGREGWERIGREVWVREAPANP